MIPYETVIGLEVHAQILTASKMFCACSADYASAAPNTHVCPVCMALPGVLPVINRAAVEKTILAGLALHCAIAEESVFARKNYHYADLPKGYQISQYERPLCRDGWLEIEAEDKAEAEPKTKRIGVTRAHLEEDTGKLTHIAEGAAEARLSEGRGDQTLVDLNRAGVPLLEIVTEPDLRSADEAYAYLVKLQRILRYLGVSTADMERGAMRCEANISVRPVGQAQFGTKVEVKNLNSFRSVKLALDYEVARQIALLERGERVVQVTMGWDEERGRTVVQRVKESSDDYRYFPEPDLPPLAIDRAWVEAIRGRLPELPDARLHRFMAEFGLDAREAAALVADRAVAEYFEAVVVALNRGVIARSGVRGCEARSKAISPMGEIASPTSLAMTNVDGIASPTSLAMTNVDGIASPTSLAMTRMVANWITGELFRLMNAAGVGIEAVKVTPDAFAELLGLVAASQINLNSAKKVLDVMFASGRLPGEIVQELGLTQVSDSDALADIVSQVVAKYPDEIAKYRGGKESVFNWLLGQVMRETRGKGNPAVVKELLTRAVAE